MAAEIKKETLDFLKNLKKHNEREWFNGHKAEYQEALTNFMEVVADLIAKIGKFDKSIIGLEAKNTLFRIYRDTRFSKDKTPYKTFFSAKIIDAKDNNCSKAAYYIHLEPGGSMIAGGIHTPETERLTPIREQISENAEAFKKIINNKTFVENFKEIWGDRLKTAPKGFDKEDPMLYYLQFKDIAIKHEMSDKTVLSRDFTDYCAGICKSMAPLNDFLNEPITIS